MAKRVWAADPAHSSIGFKVKHLMITNVSGTFGKYEINVETEEEDFMRAKVSFSADTASVNTGNAERDRHLRSPEFFDDHAYRYIRFEATKYESVDNDGSYELHGNLTIRDVTKPVKLSVEFGGVVVDPWGNTKAGFTINGKVNRKDFGLNWHAMTEAGGIMVSEDVRIVCEVQLIKQS